MRESRCTGVFPSSLSSRSTSMELCQSIQSPRIFPWERRLFQLLVNSQLERAGERPRGCCSGMAPPRTEEFRESPPTGNRPGLKKHQKTKNKPDNWKRSCKFLEKCSPRHCCSTPGPLHGWIPVFPPFLPLSQLQQHFQPLFSSTPLLYKHPGHRTPTLPILKPRQALGIPKLLPFWDANIPAWESSDPFSCRQTPGISS